ncbi:MAG: chitobiase/beta-hexosaminidase C-terminal domain-containing protein, partial [Prevotella sp.]|nr:chitobiase/beta-hexosaminidase C-terminal domain-containing protein [Prevotella sp.]
TISGVTPFTESTEVTMSGPEDADIYYTTDGSTPTAQSTLYEGGFTLSDTTTVKAIAIKNGESSEVTTKLFSKGTDDEPGGSDH